MAQVLDLKIAAQPPADMESHLQVALDKCRGRSSTPTTISNFVFCNDRFKEMYGLPAELVQPGRPYADLLRYLAEHGYYGDGDVDKLVALRVESLRNPSGKSFEDRTPDGRWYRILRRRAAGGGTVTVMTDITEQKAVPSTTWRARRRSFTSRSTTCRARSPTRTKSSISSSATTASRRCTGCRRNCCSPAAPTPTCCDYLAENGYYGEGDVDALVAPRVREPDAIRPASSFEDHTPDGRWYRISAQPAGAGGTVTVMTDITEQKQAEPDWRRRKRSSMSRSTTCRARSSTPTRT